MTDSTSSQPDPARFDGQPRGMLINSQRRDIADHALDGKPIPSLLFRTIRRLLPPDDAGAAECTVTIWIGPTPPASIAILNTLEDHTIHADHGAREFLEKRLDEIQQKMEIYEHPAGAYSLHNLLRRRQPRRRQPLQEITRCS